MLDAFLHVLQRLCSGVREPTHLRACRHNGIAHSCQHKSGSFLPTLANADGGPADLSYEEVPQTPTRVPEWIGFFYKKKDGGIVHRTSAELEVVVRRGVMLTDINSEMNWFPRLIIFLPRACTEPI